MIFDLDGTLVQTEKLKALSYARAAKALRPELSETVVIEAFKNVVGLSRHEVAQKLLARFGLEEAIWTHMAAHSVETPWQAYIQIRLKIYNDLLLDPEVIVRNQWPRNVELLKRAAESCAKVGLATMSFCTQVKRALNISNWMMSLILSLPATTWKTASPIRKSICWWLTNLRSRPLNVWLSRILPPASRQPWLPVWPALP